MYPTWGPRRPQVPLLGLHVPQLGPSRPILGPKTRPRGLPGRFLSNFGPLREALQALKHCKIQGFCCISRSATETVQNVQISPWEVPKRPPGGAQERPRRPQERPKRPQDGPKRLPSGLGGQMGSTWRLRALRRPPGAYFGPPRDDFRPSGGRFSCNFQPSGGHVRSCPVCKASASIRTTPRDVLV